MKKLSSFLRLLPCFLGFSFLFSSCVEEEICTYPGESFSYETFCKHKDKWAEPSDYTFRLEYSIGDSLVGPEYITVVTDGVAKCISNQFAERATLTLSGTNTETSTEAQFSSISAIYDYFDKIWKENPETNTSKKYVHYSCNFKTAGDVTYPAYLYQSCGVPDTDGYGGECFQIRNFSLENHKTFSQKKEAWKEPEGAYSFIYSIYYSYGRTSAQILSMKTTVDKNGTATCIVRPTYQEDADAFKRDYGDVALFGSGDNFGKFYSISEIYELIEKIWSTEEAKQSDLYGIAPFFTAQASYSDYKIPYDFETESIAREDTSSTEQEFEYMKVTVSIRYFKTEQIPNS
ncbi:MAG: hypothetical protein IJ158_02685 [Treponema sp.]|nr:hypothetical protein [Treponema sp.]